MLRLSPDRVRLYGIALTLFNLVMAVCVWIRGYFNDWQAFLTAGSLAGTRALLHPFAWQSAHGLIPSPFVYTPGVAWFYVPIARLTLLQGALVNGLCIVVLGSLCAQLAHKLYGLDHVLAYVLVFAWAPVGAALLEDQNAMVGLLFVLLAIVGLRNTAASSLPSSLLTGFAVGALLYKPQYALPLTVFLLFRKELLALTVMLLCACGWYALSFAAAGMDAHWVGHWLDVIRNYAATDFLYNADKTISFPGLLQHAGIPSAVAAIIGFVMLVVVAYSVRRQDALFAGSVVVLAGLAWSPHAWDYDAVLALPAIFWWVTRAAEPLRTRAILVAYAIAPLWLFAHPLRFDALAIVTSGGSVLMLAEAGVWRAVRSTL